MRRIFPTKSLAVLMLIGFVDLASTAWLYSRGLITELNPLMRVFISRSEWEFAAVKGATLVAAWIVMAHYATINREFVRKVCLMGSGAYVVIWTAWFFKGA